MHLPNVQDSKALLSKKAIPYITAITIVLSKPQAKHLLQAVDTAIKLNEDGNFGIPVPDYVEEEFYIICEGEHSHTL